MDWKREQQLARRQHLTQTVGTFFFKLTCIGVVFTAILAIEYSFSGWFWLSVGLTCFSAIIFMVNLTIYNRCTAELTKPG